MQYILYTFNLQNGRTTLKNIQFFSTKCSDQISVTTKQKTEIYTLLLLLNLNVTVTHKLFANNYYYYYFGRIGYFRCIGNLRRICNFVRIGRFGRISHLGRIGHFGGVLVILGV